MVAVAYESGCLRELFITKFKSQFKWGFAKVVVTRACRLQEWSQGELRLYLAGRGKSKKQQWTNNENIDGKISKDWDRATNNELEKVRPPINTANFVITATLFWPEQKPSKSFSYLKNPFNTATLLIWPDFCGPLETGLKRFNCALCTSLVTSPHQTRCFSPVTLLHLYFRAVLLVTC